MDLLVTPWMITDGRDAVADVPLVTVVVPYCPAHFLKHPP